jgi:hypothetical protein
MEQICTLKDSIGEAKTTIKQTRQFIADVRRAFVAQVPEATEYGQEGTIQLMHLPTISLDDVSRRLSQLPEAGDEPARKVAHHLKAACEYICKSTTAVVSTVLTSCSNVSKKCRGSTTRARWSS